jgi:ABC-type polysaccharide/polyol phosphate export permease
MGPRLAAVLQWNPLTPIIDGYRSVLIRGTLPDPTLFVTAAAISLVLLVSSWWLFHRAEFHFAENV